MCSSDLGDEKMAGSMSIGLPFTEHKPIGVGSQATVDMARGLDSLERSAKYGRYSYPVRAVRALLDPRAGGALDAGLQQANEMKYNFRRNLAMEATKRSNALKRDLADIEKSWIDNFGYEVDAAGNPSVKLTRDKFEDAFRLSDEIKDTAAGIAQYKPGAKYDPALAQRMTDAIQSSRELRRQVRDELEMMGGSKGLIDEADFAHAPRYQGKDTEVMLDRMYKTLGIHATSQAGRKPVLAYVPAQVIRDMLIDPLVRKTAPTPADVQAVANAYGQWLGKGSHYATATNPVLSHAEDMMKWATGHTDAFAKKVAKGQVSFLGNRYGDDVDRYFKEMYRAKAHMSSIHELFRQNILGMGDQIVQEREAHPGIQGVSRWRQRTDPVTGQMENGIVVRPNLEEAFKHRVEFPEPEKAMEVYQKALTIDPDDKRVRNQIGRAHV